MTTLPGLIAIRVLELDPGLVLALVLVLALLLVPAPVLVLAFVLLLGGVAGALDITPFSTGLSNL